MSDITTSINASPQTSDGFFVSALVLIGAIITLFIIMKNKLKKK